MGGVGGGRGGDEKSRYPAGWPPWFVTTAGGGVMNYELVGDVPGHALLWNGTHWGEG